MTTSTFVSNGQSISGELFSPSSGSSLPTVVVAYGTEGLNMPFGKLIRDFCSTLAANGFLAFIPDYFSSTRTKPGFESVFDPNGAHARFDQWITVLNDSIDHTQSLTGAATGRTAFVGFSLGGHLVLRSGAGPSVKAVIDFFGPIATSAGSNITLSIAGNLPAVQIHHGKEDKIVHYSDSETLEGWLKSKSVPYELWGYDSNGHPGQENIFPPGPGWSYQSQALATTRSIQFLSAHV